MKDKININVLLCRDADDNLTYIHDIFDTIKIGDDNKVSFDIVILINGHTDKSVINLVCAIEQLDNRSNNQKNRQAVVLKAVAIEKLDQPDKSRNSTRKLSSENNCMEFSTVYHEKGINFPGKGAYEFQIYMYSEDEIGKIISKGNELRFSDLSKDNLECTYFFEIL